MAHQQFLLASGGEPKLYREDLFQTFKYTGNDSTSRGINLEMDLAGKGGFVWTKDVDNTNGSDSEGALVMYDTIRGATKGITVSGGTAEGTHSDGVTAFTSSGYTVSNRECTNKSTTEKMAYVFRKEPKFMDIKVVNGNSETPFMVNHDLGVKPAFIMMKRTTSSGNYWRAWHKDLGNCVGNNSGSADSLNIYFSQNGTGAESEISGDSDYNVGKDASATQVRVPKGGGINGSTGQIIIIMFASHEGSSDYPSGEFGPTGDQDIIKCGFYNGNGATTVHGGPLIDLGWDPEFLMIGRMHGTFGGYVNIFDQTRGMRTPVAEHVSEAFRMSEASPGKVGHSNRGPCTFNNGFKIRGNHMDYNRNVEGGQTITNPYWYVAIRRADGVVGREPTSANRRWDASAYTSTSEPVITENFQIDASIVRKITVSNKENYIVSRVCGREYLLGNRANDSEAETDFEWEYQNAAHAGNMTSLGSTYFMNWHRCNSFDAIQYQGNGASSRVLSHKLGVTPEMIWIKSLNIREAAGYGSAHNQNNNGCQEYTGWICWHKDLNGGGNNAINYDFELNCSGANRNNTNGFKALPTSTGFTIGSNTRLNSNNMIYSAWLFAPKEGVSKIGSFTQNGSNATEVDLGFNPRFMIAWQHGGSNKFMFSTAWTWGTSASATTKTWYLNNYSNDAFAWSDAPHRITDGFSWPSGSDTWLYYCHA